MFSIQLKYSCALFFLIWFASNVRSQGFIDVGISQQIESTSDGADYGTGVSFFDFNHDGWDDITIGDINKAVETYLNNEGTFEQVYFNFPLEADINAITWVDFDNDGDSDLFYLVLNDDPRLFENLGDNIFVDIAGDAGFDMSEIQKSYGAAWGDYDRDGYLDLYVSNYNAFFTEYTTNHLYKNNGDGTFTEVTEESGTGNENKYTFVSIWMDYDEDGWIDLYVGNDRDWHLNEMYRNNGDGTFTAVGEETGLNINIHNMTNSITDYDHDGDLDVYNTGTCGTNQLLQNNNGVYVDVTVETNTAMTETCWGANWLDFDNDMDEDIYSPTTNCELSDTPNHFYVHNENHIFTSADDTIGNNGYRQLSSCVGDFNNDGRPDIVAPNDDWIFASVFENQEVNDNHFLKVSLEGTVSNRDGISSWIELYTDTITQTRYTFCGEDFMGQDSQREHFGMGAFETADSLVVRWLSGHVDTFYEIDADQTLHILEGSSITPTLLGSGLCPGASSIISVEGEYSSYLWSTDETTPEIGVSEPGTYSLVTYTDIGVPSNEVIYIVADFTPVELIQNITTPSCFGLENGSIILESANEIQIVSVNWTDDLSGTTLNNIGAGIYPYLLTDSNGCVSADTLEITQPEELIVGFETVSNLCFESCLGSIALEIAGGTSNYEVLGDVSNLCSGSYTIIVQDAQLCSVDLTFEIEEPEPISISSTLIPISCNGFCDGQVELEISGGSPEYQIFGDTSSLCSGEHSLSVTDANDCILEYAFDIVEPEALNLTVETSPINDDVLGSAEVIIEGGTPPFEIEWSNGEDGTSITDLELDAYWVEVFDANECSLLLNFNITVGLEEYQNSSLSIYPVPAKEVLFISGIQLNNESSYEVIDSSGRIVLSGKLMSQKIEVSELVSGMYFLRIESDNQNQQLPFLIATE